jgi:hypothetical protein
MTLWETIYEQCFSVAVIKGEKVGQIDIIYVRGKFRQRTLGNFNWPQFSLLTHTWWAMMDHLPPFSKPQIFQ